MVLPAIAYLGVFFVVPLWSLLRTSLSRNTGSVFLPTLEFDWAFSNYGDAFSDYRDQIIRSFGYALSATLICLVLAYPLAYAIAFKAGRWKPVMLVLVIAPFFTSFLLRTIAWQSLFSDNGPILAVVEALRLEGALDFLNITTDGKIMNTPTTVVGTFRKRKVRPTALPSLAMRRASVSLTTATWR